MDYSQQQLNAQANAQSYGQWNALQAMQQQQNVFGGQQFQTVITQGLGGLITMQQSESVARVWQKRGFKPNGEVRFFIPHSELSNYSVKQISSIYSGYVGLQLPDCAGYEFRKIIIKKESLSMFKSFREWVCNHRDLFFTVAVVLVVDRLVFKGQLQSKVQEILEKVLTRVSNQLENKKDEKSA